MTVKLSEEGKRQLKILESMSEEDLAILSFDQAISAMNKVFEIPREYDSDRYRAICSEKLKRFCKPLMEYAEAMRTNTHMVTSEDLD